MKKSGITILILSFFFASGILFGQKLVTGHLHILKGQTTVNIQYDYSDMGVGKFKNEDDYVADRTADMNKHSDGSGDKWASKWVSNRASMFQPKFETAFNAELYKYGLIAKEGVEDAKYTLIVHTTYTEPGYNVGVSSERAHIDVVVTLVETAARNVPLAVIDMPKMKNEGKMFHYGAAYDTGLRVSTCYERAGEVLGEFLVKNVFK